MTAAAAARKDRPGSAGVARGAAADPALQFKRGNPGRPKGTRDRRKVFGQQAAQALEGKCWDVLEALLTSSSWRARHEAAKTTLAYALGLPRQTLEIAGGFGDLSRELAAALAEARLRRASLDASPVSSALPAVTVTHDAKAAQLPTTVNYDGPEPEPPSIEPAELEAGGPSLQEAPGATIAADDVEAGHESASATGAQDAAAPGTVASSSRPPDPEGFFS